MSKNSNWAKSAASLCLEFGEEDGIDPRYLTKKSAPKKTGLKTLQLSKEIQRTVTLVLAGEIHDRLLRDLQVVSVEPEQDRQLFVVTVCHTEADDSCSKQEVLAALKRSQGLLRYTLAQAINRKKTPMLRFNYIGVIGKGEVYAD